MEVPHHAHGSHDKKNWKSYVSEFLMLFLAVFSGFIAENIREHYVDREKEHQYIQSMINDMAKDTVQLTLYAETNQKIIKGFDSLLLYLKKPLTDSVVKKLYVFAGYTASSSLYENANGTIAQLKNAGGFRLIRDTAASNAIAHYDLTNDALKKQADAYYRFTLDIINVLEELMDFYVGSNDKPVQKFYLKNDPDKIRILFNKCYLQKQVISGYANALSYQRKQATGYISLLKKKYHITP